MSKFTTPRRKDAARKATPPSKALKAVRSLGELYQLATKDTRYARLMQIASDNLGGSETGIDGCYRWLITNAQETDEAGVVDEVNFCRKFQ